MTSYGSTQRSGIAVSWSFNLSLSQFGRISLAEVVSKLILFSFTLLVTWTLNKGLVVFIISVVLTELYTCQPGSLNPESFRM